MGAQAVIWFVAAAAAAGLALSLLHARYVRKDPAAVRAGGGSALFAVCLLLFAAGAAAAGIAAARVGR